VGSGAKSRSWAPLTRDTRKVLSEYNEHLFFFWAKFLPTTKQRNGHGLLTRAIFYLKYEHIHYFTLIVLGPVAPGPVAPLSPFTGEEF